MWVDVIKPVIHVEIDCSDPVQFVASYETWSAESPRYKGVFANNRLEWSYRLDNELYSKTRLSVMEKCGMKGLDAKVPNPGSNLILGGRMLAKDMVPAWETTGTYMATSYKGWAMKTSGKVQTPGNKIILFPAWPKEWDVDFKLYAPQQTIVEVIVTNGKIISLKVTPESRRKDVIINPDFKEK